MEPKLRQLFRFFMPVLTLISCTISLESNSAEAGGGECTCELVLGFRGKIVLADLAGLPKNAVENTSGQKTAP